jgi:hypothetical protein
MMCRLAPLLVVLLLGLSACETSGNNVAGTADYDSLKRATDDCKAKGGTLVLKDEGDAQHIQDYVCKGT